MTILDVVVADAFVGVIVEVTVEATAEVIVEDEVVGTLTEETTEASGAIPGHHHDDPLLAASVTSTYLMEHDADEDHSEVVVRDLDAVIDHHQAILQHVVHAAHHPQIALAHQFVADATDLLLVIAHDLLHHVVEDAHHLGLILPHPGVEDIEIDQTGYPATQLDPLPLKASPTHQLPGCRSRAPLLDRDPRDPRHVEDEGHQAVHAP